MASVAATSVVDERLALVGSLKATISHLPGLFDAYDLALNHY